MAGLGTVFSCVISDRSLNTILTSFRSLFSSLFAASKTFPSHLGLASGTSMALFGLSPLFLSFIASTFFTDPDTGLNVTQFLKYHAIIAGSIHLIGAFNLRLSSVPAGEAPTTLGDPEQVSEPDERTALLPGKTPNEIAVQVIPPALEGSTMDLLRDVNFWILFVSVAIVLGSVSSRCVQYSRALQPTIMMSLV